MENLYLGHTAEYWLELDKKARDLKATELLQEIVNLKGKISFIQSRVDEINRII